MARPETLDPVLADVADRIRAALTAAGLPDADPALERPKQAEHGDWATTAALRLAKPAKRPPREIAQAIVDHLDVPDTISEVSIAGPGFVNLRLAPSYHHQLVHRIVAEGERYGSREVPADERETINVEFVSANPTGPLHVGAGRWAATGDAIAALLESQGHAVVREYYVNDSGEQVRRFGESIVLVATGQELTEDHYQGETIVELASALRAEHGDALFTETPTEVEELGGGSGEHGEEADDGSVGDPRVDAAVAAHVGVLGVEAMRQRIEDVLHTMGVDYDVWFSERLGLHEAGAVDAALTDLQARGVTYEQDGAVFLRTTDHGDDKDRVLVRSDGRPTYFAADCGYLRDKWRRVTAADAAEGATSDAGDGTAADPGADTSGRLYYLLGADHHGYVARLKAAAACLGLPADRVEVRIGQFVNLLRGGEPVRMSKRAGATVDLGEVIEEVGSDVTRYHFLRQGLDTTIDFDLAVVAEQSMENPVYYVQYAHARIASLVRWADERGFEHGTLEDADLRLLTHPAESALLSEMAQLPLVVSEAAELRATQRLARYAEDLAATFHRFYTECRVIAPEDPDRSAEEQAALDAVGRARYWLAVAAKQTLANALALLRVSAPERL
jgi:arginyl-tRNA synthetase